MILTCSANRKYQGAPCYSRAVWAIKRRDGQHWHGACHLHPHQVLKRLGADGGELEVRTAQSAMDELERVKNVQRAVTRAEELVDTFRSLVQDADRIWTAEYSVDMLVHHGHLPPPADAPQVQDALLLARELLELLCAKAFSSTGVRGGTSRSAHCPTQNQPFSAHRATV